MEEKTSTIRLDGRKKMHLTGISEVICFLEDHGELTGTDGILVVTGEGLHMEKLDLDKGEVLITGRVDSLYYPAGDEPVKKSIFRKIFS